MKKSAEFKLKLTCIGTSAYGLNASLDMNTGMCPAPVRSAMRGIVSALGGIGREFMLEQSAKLINAMDKVFNKNSKIYRMPGYNGDTVREWYVRLRLFLVAVDYIEDKSMKEWFGTEEGKKTLDQMLWQTMAIAEKLVREEDGASK